MAGLPNVGFLGAGKVAQTIAKGLLGAGKIPPQMMMASAPSERNLKLLKTLGMRTTHSNKELVDTCEVVFLSVKPNMITPLLKEVAPLISTNHLVVSLAAGITIDFIESKLPVGSRVIRAMPNTPCIINEGASVFSLGTTVKEADGYLVKSLFNSLGYCLEGDESMIDAVMAVSGSGPAYAFVAIDALADGGVKMGLPRDIAIKLAAQTLLGSAKLVLESGKHPSELKDDVCSPGGTTIEAIHQLEKGGFRRCLIEAVEAACLKGSAKLVIQGNKHPSELKDDVCSPGGTTIEAIHQLEKGGFRRCLIEAVEAACLKARTLNELSAFSRK